jgi:hypothetical protein
VSTAAVERPALRTATLIPTLALTVLTTALFARLLPDIAGKPLHEDEAVAGLISARPLGEMLHTVVLDRGGAPLHFLLAHLALQIDTNAETLRWLSLVFALATVPLCYDLARRLAGRLAGLTAAALAATSQLLLVYGTFGRMYSLFACASALSADLFVRALARPTQRTAVIAAAAALVPLAVHPFGAFLFAAEVVVALWLWRGQASTRAWPVLAIAALALPLLLADVRLSDRYAPEAGKDLDGGEAPMRAVLHALGGSAGGRGALLAIFGLLAARGAIALARRQPAAAAFACLTVAVPPAVLAAASAVGATSDRLGPRHLIFMLPVWLALVAAGVTSLSPRVPVFTAALVVALAAMAPDAIPEPRTISTGTGNAVAAPAAWLDSKLSSGDVLYPYSPVFLAALPTAAEARGFSREPVALARAAKRTRTVPAVFVSIPLQEPVHRRALRKARLTFHEFPSWLILETRGPFADGTTALQSTAQLLERAAPAIVQPAARAYLNQIRGTACTALSRLGSAC